MENYNRQKTRGDYASGAIVALGRKSNPSSKIETPRGVVGDPVTPSFTVTVPAKKASTAAGGGLLKKGIQKAGKAGAGSRLDSKVGTKRKSIDAKGEDSDDPLDLLAEETKSATQQRRRPKAPDMELDDDDDDLPESAFAAVTAKNAKKAAPVPKPKSLSGAGTTSKPKAASKASSSILNIKTPKEFAEQKGAKGKESSEAKAKSGVGGKAPKSSLKKKQRMILSSDEDEDEPEPRKDAEVIELDDEPVQEPEIATTTKPRPKPRRKEKPKADNASSNRSGDARISDNEPMVLDDDKENNGAKGKDKGSPLRKPAAFPMQATPEPTRSLVVESFPMKVAHSDKEAKTRRGPAPFPLLSQASNVDLKTIRSSRDDIRSEDDPIDARGASLSQSSSGSSGSLVSNHKACPDSDDEVATALGGDAKQRISSEIGKITRTLASSSTFEPEIIDTSKLCPFCDEPLPEHPSRSFISLLAKIKRQAWLEPRESNPQGLGAPLESSVIVCQAHHDEHRLIPQGIARGWPQVINFAGVPRRLELMKAKLRKLVEAPFGPYWDAAKRDIQTKGKGKANSLAGQMETFRDAQPGYYGEKGTMVLNFALLSMFPPRNMSREAIEPLGPEDFIRRVLIPEAAVLLIREDLGISREDAIKVVRESRDYGQAMFQAQPGLDGEDDDGWMVQVPSLARPPPSKDNQKTRLNTPPPHPDKKSPGNLISVPIEISLETPPKPLKGSASLPISAERGPATSSSVDGKQQYLRPPELIWSAGGSPPAVDSNRRNQQKSVQASTNFTSKWGTNKEVANVTSKASDPSLKASIYDIFNESEDSQERDDMEMSEPDIVTPEKLKNGGQVGKTGSAASRGQPSLFQQESHTKKDEWGMGKEITEEYSWLLNDSNDGGESFRERTSSPEV